MDDDAGEEESALGKAQGNIKITPLGLFLYFSLRLMAEETGFEPANELPRYTLSKRAPSTTRTLFRSPNYTTQKIISHPYFPLFKNPNKCYNIPSQF